MMKLLPFLLIFSFSACASYQQTISQRITQNIEPQIGVSRFGAVVGIYKDGKFSYLKFGGVDEKSVLEIASLTKTFTTLLYSIAVERGLVKLETRLADIRPEWRRQKLGRVTLLELATHSSGLPRLPCDFHYSDPSNPYAEYTEKELIRSLTDKVINTSADCTIAAHPTVEIAYSNWGMAILGHAISFKAGLSYEELLKEWITGPLGMKDTVVVLNSEQRSRLAQGYTNELKPTGLWQRAGMWGNGAIKSTASDIMIYARAMLNPDETPMASAIKAVQVRQHSHIGLGWFITRSGNIWHDGMTGGYASLFKAYLKEDQAVFALSNTASEITCLIEAVENLECRNYLPQR